MLTQQQLPISFQSDVSCHLPVSFFTRHPPNPNHRLSKTPTIPSHQVSSFQSQLELFPFLYPLTPDSVFLSRENSCSSPPHPNSTPKNRPLSHPDMQGVISGFPRQSNSARQMDSFSFKEKPADKAKLPRAVLKALHNLAINYLYGFLSNYYLTKTTTAKPVYPTV